MTVADVKPFDLGGPLPTGMTVLEASAGTGKTFTIAALAARFVAEGMPLDRLLMVTFTRMATGELRNRVRERLVVSESGLARAIAGIKDASGDGVLQLLTEGSPDELRLRRYRLGAAIADFDAATILTTHGFCQHVLSGLGVAGDVERDVTFVEDLDDVLEEVVDDLYVRKFQRGSEPPFSRAEALRIGRVAVVNPLAPIEPHAAGSRIVPAMRRALAVAVRGEVERRKRANRVMTYDDLLTRLRDTLHDDVRGPNACRRLRSRYRVVLVDEFQDTDPVQWDILRLGFGAPGTTLVLIGDPKQAIYAFRGADVYAYLDAARAAGTEETLRTNWRSDEALLTAYDAVFRGVKLGHEGIVYRTVVAAPANKVSRLINAPAPAPLRVRVVHRDDALVRLTAQGYVSNASGREHIAADLAGDLVSLLSSAAEVVSRNPDGRPAGRERVRPGHLAVLVRTHRQAALVRDALEHAGVPAVINGAGSVFATPVAREWLRLLEALERPASATRAASAALTTFLGWTADQVASADERAWEAVRTRLHQWAGVLRRRGVASLLETMTLSEGLPGRILARVDGERQLTDLRHLGQLLHAVGTSEQMGVTALTVWLRHRIAEAAEDTDNEERSRRLESDAEAVQVLTIHRSKGLEFPIVYYPFLWDGGYIPKDALPIFHDAVRSTRTIDVGGSDGPDFERHKGQYVTEQRGEDLRLAYVALTRAKHQAVVWWAGSYDSRDSPLGRLLFSRDDDGSVAPCGRFTPSVDQVIARVAELAAEAGGCISVERTDGGRQAVWAGGPHGPADLESARFDRGLDVMWRRTSYSGITAGVHDARVASEPEERVTSDEPLLAGPMVPLAPDARPAGGPRDPDEARLRAVPSRLADMPGSREIGTLVHRVLERTDFTAADLGAELEVRVAQERARAHLDVGDPALVVAGLAAAIETPLGPLLDDLRLRDIGVADRMDEMAFELPLLGGDRPTGELGLGPVASLVRRHLMADDVLARYAERLGDPTLRGDLRGYLAGSLDVVLRTRRDDGTPRFCVVDYKTNWLGTDGEPLSAWHYRPAALAEAMQAAHYPLQALLYTTALHRFLRWRLAGYDAARNLGGVLYLFVRGMGGAATPRVGTVPCGVFAWMPPPALVEELSDLFDQGEAA